jgi:predicted DCC family thiol-disulfide oxidoreductase YuxK
MDRLTILYDERCALCVRCRAWMEAQPAFVRLEFVAAGSTEAMERFGVVPWLGDELVVVADDGRVWAGPAAFLVCLWALEAWREWSYRLSATRASAKMAERFFISLSARRKWLAGWLAHPECTSGACSARGLRPAAPYR